MRMENPGAGKGPIAICCSLKFFWSIIGRWLWRPSKKSAVNSSKIWPVISMIRRACRYIAISIRVGSISDKETVCDGNGSPSERVSMSRNKERVIGWAYSSSASSAGDAVVWSGGGTAGGGIAGGTAGGCEAYWQSRPFLIWEIWRLATSREYHHARWYGNPSDTYPMQEPQDGSALLHFFFRALQFKHACRRCCDDGPMLIVYNGLSINAV